MSTRRLLRNRVPRPWNRSRSEITRASEKDENPKAEDREGERERERTNREPRRAPSMSPLTCINVADQF